MADKIRVMIADDNRAFRDMIHSALSAYGEFEVVAHAANGPETVKILHEIEADILILDIIMPIFDGIAVLEKIRGDAEVKKRPYIIMASSMSDENIVKRVMELGANYFFLKPFDTGSLIRRIHDFMDADAVPSETVMPQKQAESINRRFMEREVAQIMQEIGLSPHLLGYRYLREAILLVIDDIDLLNAITLKLYPMIAERFHSNPARVERSMRHAIETAWNRGRIEVLNKYFGYTISDYKGKPTNSEFIAMIADWISLRMV